jgi:transcriptional regulator with XRE-family HTH domain
MREHGVSQRELARRLGRSEPWISRVLNERENTTLKTVADLGWALGLRFALAPQPLKRDETPAGGDPELPEWLTRQARRAAPRAKPRSVVK